MENYKDQLVENILEQLRDLLSHNRIYLKIDTDDVGLSIMLRSEDEAWRYESIGKISSSIIDEEEINSLLGYDEDEDEDEEDYE